MLGLATRRELIQTDANNRWCAVYILIGITFGRFAALRYSSAPSFTPSSVRQSTLPLLERPSTTAEAAEGALNS